MEEVTKHAKRTPEQKAEVLKLLAAGTDPAIISRDLKLPVSTIHYWRKTADAKGGKADVLKIQAENERLRNLLKESLLNEALAKAA